MSSIEIKDRYCGGGVIAEAEKRELTPPPALLLSQQAQIVPNFHTFSVSNLKFPDPMYNYNID